MGTSPCAQCGQPLTEGARVCTQCGAKVAQPSFAAQTMLGFSSPFAKPQAPAPAAPVAPLANAPMAQTMLGFAAPAELRNLVPGAPAAAPAPTPPAARPNPIGQKTMLGVAAPGIAPAASAPAPIAQKPMALGGGTMLGVAMPGIAPAHSQPGVVPHALREAPPQQQAPRQFIQAPLPQALPAPAPFMRDVAPAAPIVVAPRKGFPIAIVALIGGALVLGFGVVLLVVARTSAPIAATAKVSAEGKEQLHLRCDSCKDGTTAMLATSKATFKNKEADLDLPAPLAIGDNGFQIQIDRPGVGRDETVKLVLPLAYRIRGDVSEIGATPPVIKVQVEAAPGVSVVVDGKPIALDGSGKAAVTYDVSTETTGPAEARTIERKIPYEVTGKDKNKSTGEVAVRVGVLALQLDAPGAQMTTEDASIWVAGHTAKGAEVTANGTALVVSADGSFEGKVDVAPGPQAIVVRAGPAHDAAAKAAPRTINVNVKRALSIAAEPADKPTNIDGATPGQAITISGSVVEARAAHHHTILLVDVKRCTASPCLVRIDLGEESTIRANDWVLASGVVSKPITTPEGKTLTVIDAAFVRKAAHK